MRHRLIFQCDCFARFAVVHRHLADDYESSSHRKAEVRNRELRTGSRTPPVFADSLPDAFGRGLVDRWLTEKGCVRSEITALDRLAYCDTRGEGGAGFPSPPMCTVGTESDFMLYYPCLEVEPGDLDDSRTPIQLLSL